MTAKHETICVRTRGKGTYEITDEEKIAPEDGDYAHTLEGPDDTTSHLRMALTRTSEVIPIAGGRMALGTWQGIFVFEHRRVTHTRQVDVAVVGV